MHPSSLSRRSLRGAALGAALILPIAALVPAALVPAAVGAEPAAAKEIVQYRLPQWKRLHLHDEKKAEKLYETFQQLRCEVQKKDHNGHIDLLYRCPKWQQMSPETHEEAHKWEAWLKTYGFETKHEH